MSGKKKAKLFIYNDLASKKVPTTGFEPAHLMAPPPQDGMSTNFTTWALTTDKDNFFNGLENQTLKINDVKIKLEIILK